jgi:hypothetical protein
MIALVTWHMQAGGGSATLSMAYAGAQFAFSVLRAANGEKVYFY